MRRSPTTLTAALAAGLLLVLGACAGSADDTADAENAAPPGEMTQDGAAEDRVVQTEQGPVTVPGDPTTVVVLNHALAGYLYALDVPVTATIPQDADADEGVFSPFWADEAEADGTVFLPWGTDGFDLEGIAALEPDLIVGGGLGFPLAQAVEAYDRLSQLAPTLLVGNAEQTWQDQFSFLAEAFGKGDLYAEHLQAYEDRLVEVRDAITVPENPVGFVVMSADLRPYVLVEDSALPQMFADVGFEPAPLFAESGAEVYGGAGDMFEVSPELVGQVVTTPTAFVMGFNADVTDVATLQQEPIWAALPAFSAGQAYDLPYWALRGDYDEAMATLDLLEERFGA